MTDYANPYPALPVGPPNDRRTWLIVFGIFALVIGGLSACLTIFTPLGLLMAHAMPRQPGTPPPPDWRTAIAAIVVYGVVAGAFIAGGVASIRARRWARPFMLSVAWTWLLLGIFGSVFLVAIMPTMSESMAMTQAANPGAPAMPAGFGQAMIWIIAIVSLALYLVLPTIFILFYRSPHVRTTLEFYDPTPGWSDRAPVSVFGLALGLAVSALFVLPMLAHAMFPLFGVLLTGPAAIIATLATAVLLGLAAWLVFRLSMAGWWLTMAISIALPVMMIVSARTIGVVRMYEAMGMPAEQVEPLRHNTLIQGPLVPAATALLGFAGVAYLLAVRKFFASSSGSEGTSGSGAASTPP
jgi:uncharacterized membrane protein